MQCRTGTLAVTLLFSAAAMLSPDSQAGASPAARPHFRYRYSVAERPEARTAGRGWLGIYLQEIGELTRSALGLEERQGILVSRVVKGSAAEKAGLKRGDVILKVGTSEVNSEGDVREALRGMAGKSTALQILRGGKTLSLNAMPEERSSTGDVADDSVDEGDEGFSFQTPDAPEAPEVPRDFEGPRDITVIMGGGAYLGVEPQSLGRELGDAFGVPDGRGVLLAMVVPGGPAAKAGLRAGDVITSFNGTRLGSVADLRRSLKEVRGSKTVTLEAVRKGESRKFTVEVKGSAGRNLTHMRLPDLQKWNWHMDADREDIQKEIRDLKEQLRELKEQLRDIRK